VDSVFGLKVIAALAIFIIGKWAAKIFKSIANTVMTNEPSIAKYHEPYLSGGNQI